MESSLVTHKAVLLAVLLLNNLIPVCVNKSLPASPVCMSATMRHSCELKLDGVMRYALRICSTVPVREKKC